LLPFVILEPTEITSIAQAALRNARGQFGRMPSGGDWGYVYDVISTLATIDALRGKDHICIPNDVRTLVEIATHPDYLSDYAQRKGWRELYSATWGTRISQRQRAQGVLLDWQRPYLEQPVDERVVTRLGDGTVTIELDRPFISPISGKEVQALPVPYRWVRNVAAGTVGVVAQVEDRFFAVSIDKANLRYGSLGCQKNYKK
jgi:hypothetical protein